MDFENIKCAMADLEEDTLIDACKAIIEEGGAEAQEAFNAMQEGMQEVGSRYESGEYFVGDLIYAGEIMTDAVEILKPALAGEGSASVGRMILCTVKDDLHDIGKNIVKAMLEANGFEVVDLGIDTSPEKIVETAKAENINIIALSGVLTLSLDSMKNVVEAFKAAGIRDSVRIIIGGAPVSESACAACGADAWAHSPQKTVDVCRNWIRETNQ